MFACSGSCALKAHKRCLGSAAAEVKEDDKTFKCAQCLQPSEPITCQVCCVKGKGLYTKVSNQQDMWVHHICGLLNDDYQVPDLTKMEFTFEKAIKLEEQKIRHDEVAPEEAVIPQCDFCKSTQGQFFSCLKRQCKRKVHPYCLSEELKVRQIKNAVGEVEDSFYDDEDSQKDVAEIDEGWDFQYKLQDFTLVKHLSTQFD